MIGNEGEPTSMLVWIPPCLTTQGDRDVLRTENDYLASSTLSKPKKQASTPVGPQWDSDHLTPLAAF